MDYDLAALFKTAPYEAIGLAIMAGMTYLWKYKAEKKDENKAREIDNVEIERLKTALNVVIKERDDERDRADAAFQKQLDLTERFSEMRAQNERLSVQMENLGKQMTLIATENERLRDQVVKLTEQVHQVTSQNKLLSDKLQQLQTTLNTSASQ